MPTFQDIASFYSQNPIIAVNPLRSNWDSLVSGVLFRIQQGFEHRISILGEFTSFQVGLGNVKHTFQGVARILCTQF